MFGAFWTSWENLIEPQVLTETARAALQAQGLLPITSINIETYQNVATLTSVGYNGSLDGSFADGRLGYGLNVTEAYARGNAGTGPEPLPASPSLFGNARVSYAAGGYFPTAALAVSYMNSRLVDRAYHEGWANLPTAPAVAVFRATLGAPVPGVPGLAYRVIGSVTTASHGAYAAGNVPEVSYKLPEPTLAPLDQFSVIFGLRYDFATGGSSSGAQGSP
jgi:hypothetical protein